MTEVSPGWYPSPTSPGKVQWWDGNAWSKDTLTDFTRLNIDGLGRREARELVRQLSQQIHRLEESINRHGLRTAVQFDAWQKEQRHKLAEDYERLRSLEQQATQRLEQAHRDAAGIVSASQANADSRRASMVKEAEHERAQLLAEVAELRKSVVSLRDTSKFQEVGLFDFDHPAELSTELATELEHLRTRIKALIRENRASVANTGLTFQGSASQGRQLTNNLRKVLLRAYNAEAENAVKATKAGNLSTAQARLSRAADQIAKNGQQIGMRITPEFHHLRLKEIELANRHLKAVQREKELERERREELREQRKAEQELMKEHARLEKERGHYLSAIAVLEEKGDVEGVERVRAKLHDVDRAIEDVDYRTANMRAGYVYVISNVGSFGGDVVKIGMTRRLDPMDRVRELGDASVPFRFDVHALFFADDAVAIESMLHQEFAESRINRVNMRREYFRVSPLDVLNKLKAHKVEVLEFTLEPEALEHRESLVLSQESTKRQ